MQSRSVGDQRENLSIFFPSGAGTLSLLYITMAPWKIRPAEPKVNWSRYMALGA